MIKKLASLPFLRYFTSVAAFSSFKTSYGQAGTMNLTLTENDYRIKMETIWEDYSSIDFFPQNKGDKHFYIDFSESGESNRVASLSDFPDEAGKSRFLCDVSLKIPEYYSYNMKIRGDLEHIRTFIDPKTYGDVNIETISEKGKILLAKVKSENLFLKAIDGEITAKSGLEGQNLGIFTKNSPISIKKLGITRKGRINSEGGSISIPSLFSNVSSMKPKVEHFKPGNSFSFDDFKSEFLKKNFEMENTLIQAEDSQISIKNVHGSLGVQITKNGRIRIERSNSSFLYLEGGSIDVGIESITSDSIIVLNGEKNNKIQLDSRFGGNIYLVDAGEYWRESYRSGEPTIFISGVANAACIEVKDLTIFNTLRKK